MSGSKNLRHWSGQILGWGLVLVIFFVVALDLGGYEIPLALWWLLWGWSLAAATFAVLSRGMTIFVARRLLEAGFVIWIIATATFLLLRFLPGGPFDSERALPPEVKANIERRYGLEKPMAVQYVNYLGQLVRGDLGESYKYIGRSVTDIIAETLPTSFQLGFYALLVAFIFGIPLGLFAAQRHNTIWDHSAMFLAISGVALPSFMVGPLLVQVFALGIPISSWAGLLPAALWDSPLHYVLPVITLGLRPMAIIARLARSSVLDVIKADFVRTARAKGVRRDVVMYKHVLKNSLIPVLTISGPLVAGVLSGSFIIEMIFAIPGMGPHLVSSVSNRDYPLILGVTLVYSVMLVLANLVVDILYTVVDPRIRMN